MSNPASFIAMMAVVLQEVLTPHIDGVIQVEPQLSGAIEAVPSQAQEAVTFRLGAESYGDLFLAAGDQSNLRSLLQPEHLAGREDLAALAALFSEQYGRFSDLFRTWRLESTGVDSGLIPEGATAIGQLTLLRNGAKCATFELWGEASLATYLQNPDPHEAHNTGPTSLTKGSSEAHLQRVIDVPLAVNLRFGQRQLTLREVLELNTGSLVELDQHVEEAVHLMLGDRIIAKGEVVIVDGNYGMRVTEVMESSRQNLSALV